MCGIAALFFQKSKNSLLTHIQTMCDLVRHRGPDDEGYLVMDPARTTPQVFGGKDTPKDAFASPFLYCPKQQPLPGIGDAALGHRRLSIIDLSPAGHQPMCSADGRYWITYNGEIYNYIEIRAELVKRGKQFKTHSDTEVILAAYQEWGKAALHRFNGMFAFVIYDTQQYTFFAARDRFGVKPLYYWHAPEGFLALASEIKQFTCLPGWKARLQGQNGYDFLNWGVMDHHADTLFEGVKQVRGGEYLEGRHRDGLAYRIGRWYTLRDQAYTGSFEQAAEEYYALFEDAVNLRLRADVNVGSCLSGGIDSSSIVTLVNGLLKKRASVERQMTFSARSPVQQYDEGRFIHQLVQQLQLQGHTTMVNQDNLFNESQAIIWHQDEPYPSGSINAQWMVFKLVKEHGVKVMLDGQGADEQLGGYTGFFSNRFYDLWKERKWLALWREMAALRREQKGALNPYSLLLSKIIPRSIAQPLRSLLGRNSTQCAWLDMKKLGAVNRQPFAEKHLMTFQGQSMIQLTESNLPMLLHFEDRDSMAHSVESRTPFLDYRLVEFTLSLPPQYKVGEGWTKAVLRQAMKDKLPDVIRLRKDKMGFVTAEEHWMTQENPEKFRSAFHQAYAAARGVLTPQARTYAEEVIDRKRPFSHAVWRMISFGQWVERFQVSL
jgi:asparagine synthase (glutamine-hydrolysing)